jgi:hypothetical protein
LNSSKRKTKPTEEEEEEEEEEKPAAKKTFTRKPIGKLARKTEPEEEEEEKPGKKTTAKGKDTCPHGYRFGVDFEKYDKCETCKMYDACADANE